MNDATPSPTMWPECDDCGVTYVLRRVIVFGQDPGYRWLWQRDCKHRNADAVLVSAEDQP